jgi:phenylalanyl-tRNA synthetase beta chain
VKVPLSWLREFVDVRVEPARLGEDLTLAGFALDGLETSGGDAILDLDVTTNRVDGMNVYGIAREVSVIYGVPLRPLPVEHPEAGAPAEKALAVAIEAPDLCPRFCARVLDVKMGPSPSWIRDRLEAVGVRPINNVVDLTNFVMMEMGHPSHAFDLDRVPKGELRVRWGRAGERLTTLDGVERTLGPGIGAVAGPEEPLALAGIMGGASSEVGDATRVVALEAAYWQPLAIRRAAKALSVRTEASHRFERGADPEGPVAATARIAHLLAKIGAGTARPGLIDRFVAPVPPRRARLRPARVTRVLGLPVPEARSREILAGLGFVVTDAGGAMSVEIPTWRGDVSREEDLIEEVARHHGLDEVPSTLPPTRRLEGLRPHQAREREIRAALVGAGLTEVINYAFVSSAASAPGGRVALANPIAADQDVLRTSLVVPGLLANLRTSLRHGRRDVSVFELGRVFAAADGRPREERRLAILLAGAFRPAYWSEKARPADFYDLKGVLEALGRRLGLGDLEVAGGVGPAEVIHPGRGAQVRLAGVTIGYAGALHPDLQRAWELRDDAFVVEVGLEGILEGKAEVARFSSLPRFPPIDRDLSIVCDATVPAAEIVGRVRSSAAARLRSVAVVDRYAGDPIPRGKVGLTLSLRFQDPGRTLTSDEIQESVEAVIRDLRSAGAEVRGE